MIKNLSGSTLSPITTNAAQVLGMETTSTPDNTKVKTNSTLELEMHIIPACDRVATDWSLANAARFMTSIFRSCRGTNMRLDLLLCD